MNVVKRVAKNSSITIAARAMNLLSSLIILALVARYLNQELFGKYIFVMAFIAVFEVFTDMGYNSILVREIARAKDQLGKLIGTAIVAKFLIAVLTFVIIFVSANAFGLVVQLSTEVRKAIYVLAFAVTMDFFVDICISTIRAHEQMEYEAIIITFNRISSLLFIAIVVIFDLGFLNLFLARLYSNVLTLGLSLCIYIRKFGKFQISRDSSVQKHLTKEALPLGTGQVIERFYTRTNFLLIRIIQSVTEVGFYGGAYRIIEQFSIIANSIVTAVFPVFSILSQSSRSSLALAHEKTLKLLMVMSLPMVVIMGCLAEKITTIVFGAKLMVIAQPLKVLAFMLFLNFSNLLFKFTLSAMNRQAVYRRNVLISFFVNLLLALFFIPVYGYMGACIAILASSGLLFMLGHYSISKYLPEVSLPTVLVKPVMSGLVMALFLVLVRHMDLFFVIPCGIFVYLLTLIALRPFTRDEIDMLKRTTIPIQEDYSKEGMKHAK